MRPVSLCADITYMSIAVDPLFSGAEKKQRQTGNLVNSDPAVEGGLHVHLYLKLQTRNGGRWRARTATAL